MKRELGRRKGALTTAVAIAELLASDWKPKTMQFVQKYKKQKLGGGSK